ncbi:MAG: hypothetical protein P1V97_09350, partial [Planctomycetota bacterium]|nr:hypothetical protein [Planctomycetota bacterium]
GIKSDLVIEALTAALDNKDARLSAVTAGRRLLIRDQAFLSRVKAFTSSADSQLAEEAKRLMKLYGNEHF